MKNLISICCTWLLLLPCWLQAAVWQHHNPPAQQTPVTGLVKDSKGQPLPGVTVTLANGDGQTGTQTDAEGSFRISAPANGTLQFSFIGYKTVSMPLNGRRQLEVTLETAATELTDVVVVGYGTQKKVNLTGAVVTATAEELNKRVVTNPASLLQGRLPGLNVVESTGEPGNEGVSLRVRGVGTFSGAGNDPLVIIDGIPGNLNAINPNDIATVSVLKDAASAAIYGARAANGVILVTTKKGGKEGLHLEYSYNLGITSATRLPKLITNSVEYMELYNKALAHSGQAPAYPDEFIDQYRNATDKVRYPDVNWLDIVFRTVYTQNHYLSVSGGKGGTSYNVGLGYIDQPGTMMGFDFKKYTLQFNLNSEVNRRLTFGANLNFNYSDRHYPRQGSEDQFLATLSQGPMYGPIVPDGSGHYTYRGDPYVYHNKNPVAIADHVQAVEREYYVQGSLFATVKLLEGLTWETRGGFNFRFEKIKDFRPVLPLYDWFTGEYATDLDVGEKGLQVDDGNSIYPVIYTQLTYEKKLGPHQLKVLGGAQEEYYKEEDLGGYRRDFPGNDHRELDAAGTDGQRSSGTAFEWALRSFYGRLNYDYRDKYLFEANMRYDGSSRFAGDTRWGFFPSFSAGWRLAQEPFLQSAAWLNDLKLRASWGKLGNQNIGNYPYQNVLKTGTNYPMDNSAVYPGAQRQTLVDEDIRWETTRVLDIGLDFTVLNNRLTLNADWYDKKTYDILRTAQVPGWLGLNGPVINGGTMRNTGWEFGIKYQDQMGDLSYGAGINFQAFKNELTKFGAREIGSNVIREEGHPYNTYYLYEVAGIFQSEEEIRNAPAQPFDPKPGDLRFRDVNGDKVINASDRTYADGAYPSFTYSLNLNAAYKHFDLTAFFYGVEGQKFYVTGWGIEPFTQSTPPTEEWRNAWTPENPGASLPAIYVSGYGPISGMPSTFLLRDASFLRLKNVQLGYSLQAGWLQRAGISALRIYFAGDNLFTITNYPSLDPERGSSSTRFVNYPQNRIYSFGARVTF
ncbi:SusC/RagA family TonB-linked outer membrane protein [Chitinophaga japonensis]|uniref:TonB-linked SusC/RagA family outer membrane protein n=1 Tax=Chitinophaga japonensis TaxID=104662 RepID=A0A562T705_CHIJA|nr:TonB-dependent receptor [Chitinophaga japonensis]TWI89339.1 TonB-linked SusC/RagA family outer membrane protein [Chitinophaga japonensis]